MMKVRLIRHLRRALGGYAPYSSADPFTKLAHSHREAVSSIQLFYILNLFLVFSMLIAFWEQWRSVKTIVPLWPLFWVEWVGLSHAVDLICWAVLISTVVVAANPEKWMTRLVHFVALFELIALTNSFGKLNHGWHLWIYASFFLLFLPDNGWRQRSSLCEKMSFVTVIWSIQLSILLMYSMSGIWKIYAGINQYLLGQIHAFHPYALAYLTADRLFQTGSSSILGPFIIENPLIGWPLHYLAIYLETFSLLIAFRPPLHRLWGLCLCLFHISIYLTMSIPFNFNLFILGIFLVYSPFRPQDVQLSDVLLSLPLIGELLRITPARKWLQSA